MMDTTLTDAEIAANWSIEATRAGRLELAEAALRIAMQAQRSGTRHPKIVEVPLAGHTRHEYPRLRAAAPEHGPTGNGGADELAPAATAVIPMPTGEHEGSRCVAKVLKGNVYAECHGAVLWVPATAGGPAVPFVEAHWAHVDRLLEQDHKAQV